MVGRIMAHAFQDELEKIGGALRYLRMAESSRAPESAVEMAKAKFLRRAARYTKDYPDDFPGGANLLARDRNPSIDAYARRVSGGAPAPKRLMSGRSDTPESWLARESHAVGWYPEGK